MLAGAIGHRLTTIPPSVPVPFLPDEHAWEIGELFSNIKGGGTVVALAWALYLEANGPGTSSCSAPTAAAARCSQLTQQ